MDIQTIRKTQKEVDEQLGLIPKIQPNADDQEVMGRLKQVANMFYLHNARLSIITMVVLKALKEGAILNGNALELPEGKSVKEIIENL